MAASTVVKNFSDGSISLFDGAGSPNTISAAFSQGDLSIDGLVEDQREISAYETRGVLKSVRKTTRIYPTGSFTIMLTDLTDASDTTVVDFCLKQGSFNGNTTTLSGSDVYAIKIGLTIEGTNYGDANDHTITLDDCRVTMALAEGDPSTVSVSFTCYGAITMT
tara:strand:+ start:268 stop:759 length:492 start_codon:yes stop_codon:yes gene_type:complete